MYDAIASCLDFGASEFMMVRRVTDGHGHRLDQCHDDSTVHRTDPFSSGPWVGQVTQVRPGSALITVISPWHEPEKRTDASNSV